MGIYSDNFYSWMDRHFEADKEVMDKKPNGYKHPDGSPCYAKSIQSCPFYKAAQHETIKEDLLDPVSKVQAYATEKEFNAVRQGDKPKSAFVRGVKIDECDTFKVGSTKSKYRELRNKGFAAILQRKANGEKGLDGTYPLDNPTEKVQHKGKDGKMHDGFADGWQVSFQTTNGEGFNPRSGLKLSDEEYDKTVEDLIKETGSRPYLGIWGEIPEISFRCDSKKQAQEIAEKHQQVAICNNKRIANNIFDRFTFPKNLKYDWRKNQTCVKK